MPLFYCDKPAATMDDEDDDAFEQVDISESFDEPRNARECIFSHQIPVLRDDDPLPSHVPQASASNLPRSADAQTAVHSLLKANHVKRILFKFDYDLIQNLHKELKAQLCTRRTEPNPAFLASWLAQLAAQQRTHDVCVFPHEEDQRSAYRCSMLTLASLFVDEGSNLSSSGVEARDRLRPTFSLAPDVGPCKSDVACFCMNVESELGFLIDFKRRAVVMELEAFLGQLVGYGVRQSTSAKFNGTHLVFGSKVSKTVALLLTQVHKYTFFC